MSASQEEEQRISEDQTQSVGADAAGVDSYCPVCSQPLVQEKCKVVCRSATCTYRIVFNCSEF